MKFKFNIASFVFVLLSTFTYGQNTLRGIVTDGISTEPINNITIKVDGKGVAKTDFDGAYSIDLSLGEHTITFTNLSLGYLDQTFNITIDGKNVKLLDVEMSGVEKEEVVYTVYISESSNAGGQKKKLENEGSIETEGNEEASAKGNSNAAQIVASIPSGSVDGNNVFIRGLGDRYTKSILNGMDIPGLDPDRNAVQMDIFPTIMIDNVTVYKTFLPRLTADFTGGLIDITTIDFPSRKTIYMKGGLGYNNLTTFNSDFISYKGGSIDFLGFDDGSRKLPISPLQTIPLPSSGSQSTTDITNSFNKTMATEKGFAFLDQNYALGIGNQIQKKTKNDKKWVYGYNAVLNYRNWNTYYADAEFNTFRRSPDRSETELFKDKSSKGEYGTSDFMWTALIGQSVKFGKSKLSAVIFHTQSGTKTAANLLVKNYELNQATLVKQGLSYTQRSITNLGLSGQHYLDSTNKWRLNWNFSPTYSSIQDPDIRSTALEVSEDLGPNGEEVYLWEESVGAEVRRIFRGLTEYNLSGKIDVNRSFYQWDSLKSELSFGLSHTYKNRSFEVAEYVFKMYNMSNEVPNNPDWFFYDENIWTPQTNSGVFATGQQEPANQYSANQSISGAYIMNELPISEKFDITYGVRLERNVNKYTGLSNNALYDPNAPRYNNEEVLNKINILPSINMVYKIRKTKIDSEERKFDRNTNFRAAYTQTVARPSFREISISQIYDPIQGRRYLGNIELKQSLIHNADLRVEHFFGRGEIVSGSVFYKKFIDPIEVVANVAAPNEMKPVNAGEADVFGVEFELRKTFLFQSGMKENGKSFTVGTNLAYIVSKIDMNQVLTVIGSDTLTEKQVRINNARDGEVIGDYRQMYGQSPYIINAFLRYVDDSIGLICNLSYNVQGKKLAIIGVGGLPDVFENPFHSLNLKVSKTFGKIHLDKDESTPRWKASFSANNLLNFARIKYYEGYNAEPEVFEYLNRGMNFSASISYTIK